MATPASSTSTQSERTAAPPKCQGCFAPPQCSGRFAPAPMLGLLRTSPMLGLLRTTLSACPAGFPWAEFCASTCVCVCVGVCVRECVRVCVVFNADVLVMGMWGVIGEFVPPHTRTQPPRLHVRLGSLGSAPPQPPATAVVRAIRCAANAIHHRRWDYSSMHKCMTPPLPPPPHHASHTHTIM